MEAQLHQLYPGAVQAALQRRLNNAFPLEVRFDKDTDPPNLGATVVRDAALAAEARLSKVTSLLLGGRSSSDDEKRDRVLIDILQSSGLLRVDKPIVQFESDDDETVSGVSVTSEALSFCMMSPQEQYATLLLAALRATTSKQGTDLVGAIETLLALSAADTTCCYVFPKDESMKLLLRNLTLVAGLVYPVRIPRNDQRQEELLFSVPPVLRRTFLAHGEEGVERSKKRSRLIAEDDVPASYPPCLVRRRRLTQTNQRGHATVASQSLSDSIITETNFRLYVYTASPGAPPDLQAPRKELQGTFTPAAQILLAVLNQFADREVEVPPTFAVYRLTREGFFRAVRLGITAEQIMQFLASKAHPVMRAHSQSQGGNPESVLPAAIRDQFSMWSREASRLNFALESVLLTLPNAVATSQAANYVRECAGPNAILFETQVQLVLDKKVYDAHIRPFSGHI